MPFFFFLNLFFGLQVEKQVMGKFELEYIFIEGTVGVSLVKYIDNSNFKGLNDFVHDTDWVSNHGLVFQKGPWQVIGNYWEVEVVTTGEEGKSILYYDVQT